MGDKIKKKGQMTIFIIIAIVVVALGALIWQFYPNIVPEVGLDTTNPQTFIQSCLEEDVESVVENLSLQGGSLEPVHFYLYDNEKIEYLCYNEEYYQTCIMQQPMLKNHIESEIKKGISAQVEACFDDLETSFEKKGYSVNLKKGGMSVELLPKKIVVNIENSLTLTKDGVEKYDSFDVILNNNLYELVVIINSILNWEARYGDAEVTVYMNFYHNLQIEKKKQTDGTTIYILTERDSKNKFQFASRSLAWPAGISV